MANYKERMTAIARAIHKDYAGGKDRSAFDKAGVYANMMAQTFVKGNLNTATFVSIIHQFLGEYGDRNLRLIVKPDDSYQPSTVGFHVRRFGDELIVTECFGEDRLKPGDRIIKINRRDIGIYARGCGNWLYGDTPEREFWGGVLMMQWNITRRENDGTETELELRHYPLQSQPSEPTFTCPSEGTCCIRFAQGISEADTQALLDAHSQELSHCEKLILDLRCVRLGCDDAWLPLYSYLIDRPSRLSEVLGSQKVWRNYTRGNCVLLGRQYRGYLDDADNETRKMIDDLIEELHQKVDTGFTAEVPEPPEDRVLLPHKGILKVVVLTDTYCENDAEAFVLRASGFPKVTLLGRATMGTLDYTDLVVLPVDEKVSLIYPMSKSEAAMQGKGCIGKGISPDIYIPWTPEECEKDRLMEAALQL